MTWQSWVILPGAKRVKWMDNILKIMSRNSFFKLQLQVFKSKGRK
jgi:hypothetical protein